MKFQKYMAVGILGLTMALGFSGCQSENQKNQDAYSKIGINSMAEGDYDKAVKSFQKALDTSLGKIGAEEIDICYYKAAAQFAKKDYDGAIETYTSLIDYDKENANAYYLRGSVYLDTDKKDKAFKDYKNAVKYAGREYEIYEGIYENLTNKGETEEAKNYLKKALDIKPKDGADYAEQGHVYYLLEDYTQAKSSLDRAIDKDDKTALLYLAEVYNATDQQEQGQALLESYVKENAKDSEALNTLGMMQMKDGNYEDALKYFQMGLKNKDAVNKQELMKNEIAAYEYSGDFESAKKTMQAYIKEYKSDEEAVREYTFLKTR